MSFFFELKRRNVLRAAAMYLSAAWLAAQLITTLDDLVTLPGWVGEAFLVLAGLGFVVTLALAWQYDFTRSGIRSETEVHDDPTLARAAARRFDLAIIVVLTIALAYFVWESRFREPVAVTDTLDVVVLPVRDISLAHDQAWFANGLTEELTRALVAVPSLRVIGRDTATRFDPATQDGRTFGAEVGATHVIDSSINSDGAAIRVNSELVRVADGFTVWSESFDGQLQNLLDIQRRIATEVARGLQIHLDEERVASSENRSANFAAYQAYLQGRLHLARRTPEDLARAEMHFDHSLELDPGQSMAHSGIATVYAVTRFYARDADSARLVAQAKSHARRAIELDDSNAEAHAVLGSVLMLFDRDLDGATSELQRAYDLAPGDADILNAWGDLHYWSGDFPAALDFEGRAAARDPLSAVNHLDLAIVLGFLGRYAQAVDEARLSRELNPALANAAWQVFRLTLLSGDVEASRSILAGNHEAMGPSFSAQARLRLAMHDGDVDGALRVAVERAEVAAAGGQSAATVALLFALAADDAAAARWVDKAFAANDAILNSPMYFFLPEDWAHLPATEAALSRPEVAALYAIRRRNRR